MDNNKLFDNFKRRIAISNFRLEYENGKKHEYSPKDNLKDWSRYIMKKRVVTIVSICIILLSGLGVAANYDKIVSSFGLGNGIDTAVENGYIADLEMEYKNSTTDATNEQKGVILENINVNAKVSDFLMDDLNISTHFDFQFDKKINEIIDLDNYLNIELKDLIVTDEENRILFCQDRLTFEEYCKNNNLDYEYGKFNDNYYNCGLNSFVERHYRETGSVQLTYNMYAGDARYPKSKKLNFQFKQIKLNPENEDDLITIKGFWEINIDVPEKMYSRQSVTYKVVKNENPNFQITNATLYNTGFELGIIISNISEAKQPQVLQDLWKKYENGEISIDEYNRIINTDDIISKEYFNYHLNKSHPIKIRDHFNDIEDINSITYVENENSKKFKASQSPSRKQDSNFIDGNKFSFYETFELTPKDASDKLKVRVICNDKPYIIELEKVK